MRRRRAGLGLLAACFLGTIALAGESHPAVAPKGGPGSLTGVWVVSGYKGSMYFTPRQREIHTTEGQLPPLKPDAAALFEQRLEAAEQGEPYQNTLMQCLPGGVPEMVFGSPYPVQIVESPGQVIILYEMFNHFRIIHLGAQHPKDPDPTFMGDSTGHWEGDTLVIDTVGLTDRTTIDELGIPHSDALHVVERYRRVDAKSISVLLTIDDPNVFTKPWQAKLLYKAARPGATLMEYICENNRSF